MSTLTQFLGGGTPVGGYVSAQSSGWGPNQTIGTQEFLATGTAKTYSATYAPLIATSKNFGLADSTPATGTGWNTATGGYPAKLHFVSSTYYVVTFDPNATYTYGSSLSATPTNNSIGYQGYDSISYGTGVLVSSSNATTGQISRGTTGAIVAREVFAASDAYLLAASGALAVAVRRTCGVALGDIITSTDGITWTQRTPTIDMPGTVQRVVWSTPGACFIYVCSDGSIYTTTDGFTLTLRTTPAGMGTPTTLSYGWSLYSATSSAITVIGISSGILLTTTNGTSYTLVDLKNISGLFGYGFTSSGGYIVYDGTRFVIVNPNTPVTYYSTDGTNWNLDYARYSSTSGYTLYYTNGLSYGNSKIFVLAAATSGGAGRLYDVTGKIAMATPDYVGTQLVVSNTFLRIA